MVYITESLPALPRGYRMWWTFVIFYSAVFNPPPIWGVTLPCRQLQMTKQRDPPSFPLYSWQPGHRHRARTWQQEARPTIWTTEWG